MISSKSEYRTEHYRFQRTSRYPGLMDRTPPIQSLGERIAGTGLVLTSIGALLYCAVRFWV